MVDEEAFRNVGRARFKVYRGGETISFGHLELLEVPDGVVDRGTEGAAYNT